MQINMVENAKANLAKAQKELREAQSLEMWYRNNPVNYMADLVTKCIGDVNQTKKDGRDRLTMAKDALQIIDAKTFVALMIALGRVDA